MEKVCKVLAEIYGTISSIGVLAMAIMLGKDNWGDWNWILTFSILIGGLFTVAMITSALHAIGEILEKVQSIEYYLQYNSAKTPENASNNRSKLIDEPGSLQNRDMGRGENSGMGRCEKCGRSGVIIYKSTIETSNGIKTGYVCGKCMEEKDD